MGPSPPTAVIETAPHHRLLGSRSCELPRFLSMDFGTVAHGVVVEHYKDVPHGVHLRRVGRVDAVFAKVARHVVAQLRHLLMKGKMEEGGRSRHNEFRRSRGVYSSRKSKNWQGQGYDSGPRSQTAAWPSPCCVRSPLFRLVPRRLSCGLCCTPLFTKSRWGLRRVFYPSSFFSTHPLTLAILVLTDSSA